MNEVIDTSKSWAVKAFEMLAEEDDTQQESAFLASDFSVRQYKRTVNLKLASDQRRMQISVRFMRFSVRSF